MFKTRVLQEVTGRQSEVLGQRNKYLCFGLLPHQNDVPGGIVDGDVGDVDAFPDQLLQLLHTGGAQKHHGVTLLQEHHLTLQLHVL